MSGDITRAPLKDEMDTDAVLFTNARMLNRTESLQVGIATRTQCSGGSSISPSPNFCNAPCQHSRCALGKVDLKREFPKNQKHPPERQNDGSTVALEASGVMPWAEFQQRLESARSGDEKATRNLVREVHGRVDIEYVSTSVSSQPSLTYSMSSPNTSDDSKVYSNAATRRQYASLVPKGAKKIEVEHLVEALKKDISTMASSETENQMQSLIALTRDEVGRAMIGQLGGLEVVLKRLRDQPGKEGIQIVGLHLITTLCLESASNRQIVSACDGAEIFVGLLKRHERQKPKIVERTLLAFYECCRENEKSQDTAGRCGGITAVIAAMKGHRRQPGIQMHSLRVLETLARDNTENTRTMRETGTIDAILAAMRSDSSCQVTHELATDILGMLLRDHEHTQIVVGAKGGVIDVVRALSLAAGSSTATMSACVCLRYLAFEEDNRRRIAACAGAQVIIEAAEQMKASTAEAITSVLLALGNATFDGSANKALASKNGGVSTLVSIMAIHEDNVEVVECVCRVLRNISDSRQSTKKACYKQGAVAAVAAAMKNHVDVAGIQEHGAAMLINMLSGFPFAVRAAKLDEHLADVSDVYSLHEPTSMQVDHLRDELERRQMSSISTILLGRRPAVAIPSGASSTSASQSVAAARAETRAPSSTCANAGLGREASEAAGSLSQFSSIDSSQQPRGKPTASRLSSIGTNHASEYGAAMFSAAEPEITDEMIEY